MLTLVGHPESYSFIFAVFRKVDPVMKVKKKHVKLYRSYMFVILKEKIITGFKKLYNLQARFLFH